MPKPQRCRRICSKPKYTEFNTNGKKADDNIYLTLDEFEVFRLVDYEGKNHHECASIMNISRTTVTEIYKSARSKIADFLVNGKSLEITGGNYYLCNGETYPKCNKCNHGNDKIEQILKKGENVLRIAVTFENEMIFQHFGHCEQFKIYDVENNEITFSKIVPTNGSGHGALAGFLSANQVDVLICGGIGGGAKNALSQTGIKLYPGVQGNVDEAVKLFLENNLSYNPDTKCNHHDHEKDHTCGSHSCNH